MRYSTANYLMHFGIIGQKWGVRRYQNPDGSLTEAGKARYYSGFKNRDPQIIKEYVDYTYKDGGKDDNFITKYNTTGSLNDILYKTAIDSNSDIWADTNENKTIRDTYKKNAVKQLSKLTEKDKADIVKNAANLIEKDMDSNGVNYTPVNYQTGEKRNEKFIYFDDDVIAANLYRSIDNKLTKDKNTFYSIEEHNNIAKRVRERTKDYVDSVLGDIGREQVETSYVGGPKTIGESAVRDILKSNNTDFMSNALINRNDNEDIRMLFGDIYFDVDNSSDNDIRNAVNVTNNLYRDLETELRKRNIYEYD